MLVVDTHCVLVNPILIRPSYPPCQVGYTKPESIITIKTKYIYTVNANANSVRDLITLFLYKSSLTRRVYLSHLDSNYFAGQERRMALPATTQVDLSQNRQPDLYASSTIPMSFALLCVVLRFWCRWNKKAGFWLDDWLILCATVRHLRCI